MKRGDSAQTRTVPVQMPVPLKPDEQEALLSAAGPQTPWVRLVMSWLSEDIATGMGAVSSPVTAQKPLEMAHAGGGLAWALDFKERMEREIAAARKGGA
jgi:hypothetical protein